MDQLQFGSEYPKRSNICPKNQYWQSFTFPQFFSGNQSLVCQKLKSGKLRKPKHFDEFFTHKFSTIFLVIFDRMGHFKKKIHTLWDPLWNACRTRLSSLGPFLGGGDNLEQKLDYNSDIVHFLLRLFWISHTFEGLLSVEKKRVKFKIV